MSGNLIHLRKRIKSVRNTQKSTRAMKTVSASKMRRSVQDLNKTRPLMEKILSMLKVVSPDFDVDSHPLTKKYGLWKDTLLVVISADKGLCGSFNTRINEFVEARIEEIILEKKDALKTHKKSLKDKEKDEEEIGQVQMVMVGDKGHKYFQKNDYAIKNNYPKMMTRLTPELTVDLARDLKNIYEESHKEKKKASDSGSSENMTQNREIAQVEFVYTEYLSASQQKLRTEKLFPIKFDWFDEEPDCDEADIGYIFEPSKKEIFDYLLPIYINIKVRQILLLSSASEHMARMVAMETATKNATDMIRELTLTMNKLRQASITKELLEIITATEALRK